MERSEGAFTAYDGVELRLLGDVVVHVPALEFQEAVRYLRLMAQTRAGDLAAHHRLMKEFPVRAGLVSVSLGPLGCEAVFEGREVAVGRVTLGEALVLADELAAAQAGEPEGQVAVLERVPSMLVDAAGLKPADGFPLARALVEHVYEVVYGIAEDFCHHLVSSPGLQVMAMTGAAPARSRSTAASTT